MQNRTLLGVLVAATLTSGCSALLIQQPERPTAGAAASRVAPPTCTTSKTLVAIDVVIALVGTGLAVYQGVREDGSSNGAGAIGVAASGYAVSAYDSNERIDECRKVTTVEDE